MRTPVVRPWILGIAPYVPGRAATLDGGGGAKLSSNENPLGTSPAALAAFHAAAASLSRYPDAAATDLREAIATKQGLEPARVIYGTGSDENLHLAAGANAGPGDEVLYARYGFSVYDIAARRVGATPVAAPDRAYGTDVDALLERVSPRTRIVYVANPNNPTGTFAPHAEMRRLHQGLPEDCLLVVDQAYAEYLRDEEDDGMLALARHTPNVLVTRTFSKIHGLAGERIGWGYAAAEIVAALHRIRAPFNITTAGQQAAMAALDDDAFVAASRAHNDHWLAWLTAELGSLTPEGLRVIPSRANFVMVLFEGALMAEQAYHGLMEAGYITRWLPGQGLAAALRITIGSPAECHGLAAALRQLVRGSAAST
jgi:histidinol-phosphate aminotransferase